jgi:hypothetical protein
VWRDVQRHTKARFDVLKKRRVLALPAVAVVAAALAIASGALGASAPTVSGESAGAVGDSSATLTATVNPNGQATAYAFEYGTSLRAGTTYHFRVIASSPGGTTGGSDATFTTTGIAPPATPPAQATTGAVKVATVGGATLPGTVNAAASPAGEVETYYFQIGPSPSPYVLQTLPQTLKAGAAPVAVTAAVSGLQSLHQYHYRLVTVGEGGQVAVGADKTFLTLPRERLRPLAVQFTATPAFQRRIPDRVTVSGRMVPPSSLAAPLACRGYFDVTFRVGQVAVQSLRAGIHKDCTFSLPVVFHNRGRLRGGRVTVHVLFAGNRFLHRLEAPTRTIQVG